MHIHHKKSQICTPADIFGGIFNQKTQAIVAWITDTKHIPFYLSIPPCEILNWINILRENIIMHSDFRFLLACVSLFMVS